MDPTAASDQSHCLAGAFAVFSGTPSQLADDLEALVSEIRFYVVLEPAVVLNHHMALSYIHTVVALKDLAVDLEPLNSDIAHAAVFQMCGKAAMI